MPARTWLTVDFGRHAGKSLPQVVFADPDWFFWACEVGAFRKRGRAVEKQAEELRRKATAIAIPEEDNQEERVADYYIHPSTGKFAKMVLVPASQPRHEGSSPTRRLEWIDMSMPRQIAPYDKQGGRLLVKDVKYYLFGSRQRRLTRQRCEEFFEDVFNFLPEAL